MATTSTLARGVIYIHSAPRALWSPRVIALSIVGALVVGGGLLAAAAALWTVMR